MQHIMNNEIMPGRANLYWLIVLDVMATVKAMEKTTRHHNGWLKVTDHTKKHPSQTSFALGSNR